MAQTAKQDLEVPVPPQHLMTLQMSTEDENIKVLLAASTCPPPKGIASWSKVIHNFLPVPSIGVIPRFARGKAVLT